MIVIPEPNTDRSLLTLDELRAAAGVSDASMDATLIPMGAYISALITSACEIIRDGAIPPTLRLETVIETWRPKKRVPTLIPSRVPIVEIASIVENDNELDTDGYEISQGMLWRLMGDCRCMWSGCAIVATYDAGYAIVPDDLKYAAIRFVQIETSRGNRDPYLKARTVPGVLEQQWWVDPSKDSVIPAEVQDILMRGGYVNKIGWFA